MVQSAVIDIGLQRRHRLEQGRADLHDIESLLGGVVWHGVLLSTPCGGEHRSQARHFSGRLMTRPRQVVANTVVANVCSPGGQQWNPGAPVPSAPRSGVTLRSTRAAFPVFAGDRKAARLLDYFTTKYCRLMQVCHVRAPRCPYASSSKA